MNQHLTELHEKGFTVIQAGLSQELITKALNAYQKICNEMNDDRVKTLKENGRNSRLVNSHFASEDIASLFLNPCVLDVCDTFFGGRRSSIYTSLFFQEGTRQPLHRDSPVFCTLPENLFLGCWFALEDSKIENGALVGVPRSNQMFHDEYSARHAIGLNRTNDGSKIEFSDPVAWNKYQSYVKTKCDTMGLQAEAIEVSAGDIVIWHPLFLHGGLPHTSHNTRHSVVMHIIPEGVEVHGSYLYFTPYNPIEPRTMEFIQIPGSDRKMKRDVVLFAADKQ